MTRGWLAAAAALAVLPWIASGLMVVDTGEVALVYRFGEIVRSEGAGLHLRLPAPVEADQRINLTEVRRVETGSRRLLTGDTNLVETRLVVQYTVADPEAFTLAVAEPEDVVSAQVLSAAAAACAGMDVDTLLTTGRAQLQRDVLEVAQGNLDRLGVGVRLVAVDIPELAPPGPVVDAFNDVSSARGDRDTLALAAEAYASSLLPDVRGQAAEAVEQARGVGAERTAQAQGETARYRALLPSWDADRAATRQDLHARALAEVAPHLRVVVATPGAEVVIPETKEGP